MGEELNVTTEVQEDIPVEQPPVNDGAENLRLLHSSLAGDSEYADIVPKDFNKFLEQYKDPSNAQLLFSALTGDSEYKDLIPNDPVKAGAMFGIVIDPKSLGKPSAVPSQSSDGGSAMNGRGVELRSILPQTYSSEQAKADIEQNVPGAAAMNLDYDVIAKKMQGKTPAQAVREHIQTIKDPVEKLNATRTLYKSISSEAASRATQTRSQIEEIDNSLPAMQQSLDQMQAQIGELQATYPQQAEQLNEQYNQQGEQYNQLVAQRNELADAYEKDAKLIATMNAGRVAEYNIAKAKGDISRSKDGSLAAMPMNAMFGTAMQYKPEDAMTASAWNAMAPNLVRTLAGVTSFLPSYDDNRSVSHALLNVADSIEIDSKKYIPKDQQGSLVRGEINPYTIADFTGMLLGSVAGSLAGGTARAAQIFNASQGFGEMYGWGKEHGLTDAEAVTLAAPVGFVYGYLGDKGVEALSGAFTRESTKKLLLEEIKALGKNPSTNALMKVAERFLINATKGAGREGLQESVEFTSEFGMQKIGIESGRALPKFGEDYSSKAYVQGLKDNAIGGVLGGGALGGLFGAASRKTYADVVSNALQNPQAEQDFIADVDELVLSGNITPEQGDQVLANLEKAKAAAAKIPTSVTQPESVSRATELIQEKEELTAELEGKDEAMVQPITSRIEEINTELGNIASKPQVVAEEVKANEPVAEEKAPSITFEAAVSNPENDFVYNGEQGKLSQEGQTIVFETKDRIYEIGNVDEIKAKSIDELGVEQLKALDVTINDDNTLTIEGKNYVNNYSNPEAAINYDDNGNVLSVNLETENGQKRAFRGQRAEEIAYQYKLKSLEQNGTDEQIDDAIQQAEQAVETQRVADEASTKRKGKSVRTKSEEKGVTETPAVAEVKAEPKPKIKPEPVVEEAKAKPQAEPEVAPKENWNALIDNSATSRELDKVMDAIDKEGQMTPDLLNEINTKRESLNPQPTTTTNEEVNQPQGEVRTQEGGAPGIQNESDTKTESREEGKPENVQEEVKPVSKPVQAAAKATDDFIADIGNLLANEIEIAANPTGAKAVSKEMEAKLKALKDQILNGGKTYGVIFPLLPQAAGLAIDAAILAIRAGGTVVEAMQKGIKAFRSHSDYVGASDATKVQAERDMAVMLYHAIGTMVGGEERSSKFGEKQRAEVKQNGSKNLLKYIDSTYQSRNQKEVEAAAKEFIAGVGMEVAVDAAARLQVSPDMAAQVLALNYNEAKANAESDLSDANAIKLEIAFQQLQNIGTEGGRLVAMFNKFRSEMPEFVVEEFVSGVRRAYHTAMGSNSSNPATGIHKAMKAAAQVGKVKNDVFNTIAGLMSGDISLPTGVFGLSSPALKGLQDRVSAITNKKINDAFKTLVSYGEILGATDGAKGVFDKLMADVFNRGKLAVENNSEATRELVVANLNDVNGKLTNPMTPKQIEATADAFMEVYDKLCQAKMTQQINQAFRDGKRSISAGKNTKIARLILNGALDEETVRAKFASKYNLPTLTPANVAQLNKLANAAANAKGGAKVTANAALQQAIDAIRAEAKSGLNLGERLWWVPNFIYNNILAYPLTIATALGSNVIRTGGVLLDAVTSFNSNHIRNSVAGVTVDVDIPDGRGGTVKKKLDLNKTQVEFQSAMLGIPSLQQFRKSGIPDVERRIAEQPTRWKRNVMRTFLVAGQRALGMADALASPFVAAITQRQMMELFIKDMYASSGLAIPNKTTITDDINTMVRMDPSLINGMSAQAIEDVMNGNRRQQLIDRGSLDPNATFADIFGSKNPFKAETELFNEYKKRILEIHAEGINDRLNEIQQRKSNSGAQQFDQDLDFTDKLNEVDHFIARRTNEIAFLGRPPGTLGVIADLVNSASTKVPFLKYVGILPMFNNAAFNGAAYIIKMTPILNFAQLVKYQLAGTRGWKKTNSKGERKGEFETKYILNADKAGMARSVAGTTAFAVGLLWALSKLYDTPDEEKDAWKNGKGTGFIDNLTAGQKELLRDRNNQPLREGWFYKDGYPMFNYSKTPLYGLFEAVAYTHNASVFERDYFSETMFVEDNPELKEVMSGYVTNALFTVTDASAMRDFSNLLQGVMNMKPDNKDPKWYEGTMKVMEAKMANAIKNLIPLGRLQGGVENVLDVYGGENKKFATDFVDKLAMNTLYSDYVIHSNLTDPFGRDIEEVFKMNGMTAGFNLFEVKEGEVVSPLDRSYSDDKYMQLYINRNFGYSARASINAPVYLKTDELVNIEDDNIDGDEQSVGDQLMKMYAEMKANGIDVEEIKKQKNGDPYAGFMYTVELEPEQVNNVNARMGKMAKMFIDHGENFDLLKPTKDENGFTDAGFRDVMNSVYDLSRRISTYSLYGKELGEPYRQALVKSLKQFDNKIIKLGLSRPDSWVEMVDYRY